MQTSETAQTSSDSAGQLHTSVMLRQLIDGVSSKDNFTLSWLMNNLPKHSFGVILLFLAIISLLPIISVVSRILLLILGFQILLGYHCPVLPRRLTARQLPSRYLARLDRHAIPALQNLEKVVRPRWQVFLVGTRRFTAFIAMILIVLSLVAPVPMANVPPAIVSAMMALAYIEHDGLLLLLALFMAFSMLALISIAIL